MPGKPGGSSKRSGPARQELRARSARRRQARKQQRTRDQDTRHKANLYAAKLSLKLVTEIQARRQAGERVAVLAKEYGCTELELLRVVRYGRLTPWQQACAARNQARVPKQEAYAAKKKKAG